MQADVDVGEGPFPPIDETGETASEIGSHSRLHERRYRDARNDIAENARPDHARSAHFKTARLEGRFDHVAESRSSTIESRQPLAAHPRE